MRSTILLLVGLTAGVILTLVFMAGVKPEARRFAGLDHNAPSEAERLNDGAQWKRKPDPVERPPPPTATPKSAEQLAADPEAAKRQAEENSRAEKATADQAAKYKQAADKQAEEDKRREASRKAFESIATSLKERDHLPLDKAILDGKGLKRQEIVLCDVGDAAVDLRLPPLTVMKPGPEGKPAKWFELTCEPAPAPAPASDSAAAPAKDAPVVPRWQFASKAEGLPEPLPCGGAGIRDGKLIAWIDAAVEGTNPRYDENLRARTAIATGAVALFHSEDPSLATFVQVSHPMTSSLVIKKFFFDMDLRKKPVRLSGDLQTDLWPFRMDHLAVHADASRVIGKTVTATPDKSLPAAMPADGLLFRIDMTLEVADGETREPFMEAQIDIRQSVHPVTPGFSTTDAVAKMWKVLAPWNGATRFGVPGAARDMAFISVVKQLEKLAAMASAPQSPVSPETMMYFAKFAAGDDPDHGVRDFVLNKQRNLWQVIEGLGKQARTSSADPVGLHVAKWKTAIIQYVRTTSTFAEFVNAKHPAPTGPRPADKNKPADWDAKKRAYDDYFKNDAAIADLKQAVALTTDRSTPFTAENDGALAVMLFRVYDALDVVPKEKQKAFELVKALGEGDLTITGDIVAELKAGENQPALPEGMRSVLVTFVETPHASPPAHFDVPGVVDRTPH